MDKFMIKDFYRVVQLHKIINLLQVFCGVCRKLWKYDDNRQSYYNYRSVTFLLDHHSRYRILTHGILKVHYQAN